MKTIIVLLLLFVGCANPSSPINQTTVPTTGLFVCSDMVTDSSTVQFRYEFNAVNGKCDTVHFWTFAVDNGALFTGDDWKLPNLGGDSILCSNSGHKLTGHFEGNQFTGSYAVYGLYSFTRNTKATIR